MPQHERVQWAQLRVGIMVIVSLVLLAIAVFFISGQGGFFTRHYTLKAYLSSGGDLREGGRVRLAGISVGNVVKIRISSYLDKQRAVEVDLKIARTYQNEIRADSVASVETVGLLGESYVDISRGTPGQEVLADGGAIKTAEKADVTAVVQNTNEVIMNLNALSAKLDDITTQIQGGKGSMGKLLYDETLYNKMDATVSSVGKGRSASSCRTTPFTTAPWPPSTASTWSLMTFNMGTGVWPSSSLIPRLTTISIAL
jgi:phospholipid/cholesterol/gamma-HCH transport system substrate-binding protein